MPSEGGTPAPRATYRLQLQPAFGFAAAAAQADYLDALGISHAFSSPLLAATPGSTHGYDVTDPEHVNAELGGEAGFTAFVGTLRGHHLGLVLDIVPNHMALVTPGNRWWWDVLQHGEQSPFAGFFDIAWRPPGAGGPLRPLLLPVLSQPLAQAVAKGDVRLERHDGHWVVAHAGQRFPLAPGTEPRDAASVLDTLARQHYRLSHWSLGDRSLSYRRFFDVSTLAGLRVEDPIVLAATHRRIFAWLADGTLAGVRIDHLDGLREPRAYLERLRAAAPTAWIVAEKILARDEALPPRWPLDGTTGYDFLNRVQRLFLAPAGEAALDRAYRDFAGPRPAFKEMAAEERARVLTTMFGGDVRRLTEILIALRPHEPALSSVERETLNAAIRRWAAALPVYRTYLEPEGPMPAAGRACLDDAHTRIAAADPDHAPLHAALHALLLGERPSPLRRDFALRFQQLTPAVYAKAVEDTAFYRYQRLIALNEVGGDPTAWTLSIAAFHHACEVAQRHWPRALLATATHDTKRGEDVRARLCALSEMPAAWAAAAQRWRRLLQPHIGREGPDNNILYLFFQTLAGAWPIAEARLQTFMLKAAREAKEFTSWRHPRLRYEHALRAFIAAACRDAAFLADIGAFLPPLIAAGRVNSLAQTLLKLTAPGIPSIYNGCELWSLTLVDPDNRQPVDFELRRRLLGELSGGTLSPEAICARSDEGLPKLWLTYCALHLRRRRPGAFEGDYTPLHARGAEAGHLLAFLRGGEVITAVPLLRCGRTTWAATTLPLPTGRWRNVLTGDDLAGEAAAGDLFARFPVALLEQIQS